MNEQNHLECGNLLALSFSNTMADRMCVGHSRRIEIQSDDKSSHSTVPLTLRVRKKHHAEHDGYYSLVPMLCLGTQCTGGSASRQTKRGRASKAVCSQAEPSSYHTTLACNAGALMAIALLSIWTFADLPRMIPQACHVRGTVLRSSLYFASFMEVPGCRFR